jgi:fructose/tagatose bisphosphate aldolase
MAPGNDANKATFKGVVKVNIYTNPHLALTTGIR